MSLHSEVGFETGLYRVWRRREGEYGEFTGKYTRPGETSLVISLVTPATDTLESAAPHELQTGAGPLWVTVVSGTAPAPLTDEEEYWFIRVDDNEFKLALSQADAMALTAVDLTDAGAGTLLVHSYFVISAAIYPEGGRTIDDAPETQGSDEARTCYTDSKLYTREPGYEPDQIEIDGERWRIDKVEYFGVISDHYRYRLVRLEAP